MKNNTKKIAYAGILTAIAVVGSLISVPIGGAKCAPVQHMVNIIAAIILGPGWGVGMAFCSSLIRNLLGLGSLMAFPGSMVGALCCGFMYKYSKHIDMTCLSEALGTGLLGGLCAYPIAKYVMGLQPVGFFAYVGLFFISTAVGSILAYLLVNALHKIHVLDQL